MKKIIFPIIVFCLFQTMVTAQKLDLSIGGGGALTGFFLSYKTTSSTPMISPSGMIKAGINVKQFKIGARIDAFAFSKNNEVFGYSTSGLQGNKASLSKPAINTSAYFETGRKFGRNELLFGINAGVVFGFKQRNYNTEQQNNLNSNAFGLTAGIQVMYKREICSKMGAFVEFSPRYINVSTVVSNVRSYSLFALPIYAGVSIRL